jgi:hypothetical protein
LYIQPGYGFRDILKGSHQVKSKQGGTLKRTFRALALLLLLFASLQEMAGLYLKWTGSVGDCLLLTLFLIPALSAVPIYLRIKPFKYVALIASLGILSLNIYRMAKMGVSIPLVATSTSLLFAIILLFSLIRADKHNH